MKSFDEMWQKVAEIMKEKKNVTDVGFNLWFGESYIMDFNQGTFYISTPTEFHKDIIEKTYDEKMRDTFAMLMGTPVEIEYVVNIDESRGVFNLEKEEEGREDDSIGSEYTFENFVLGSSNRYAQAAAMSVAENPSKFYNPLLIYGASGVGKTHLMFSIKNRIKKLYPSKKIEYIRSEDFGNLFITSMQAGTTDLFHKRFRSVDVLLIDDIQFFSGKVQMQEEFFNTFNALEQSKRQIVLTSDRPPKDINNLDERLRSRFEKGLIADISSPDIETRVGIISMKTKLMGIQLEEDIIFYIADQVKSNTRQLEGIINQIKAYIMLHNTNPPISVIQGYIKAIISEAKPDPVNTEKVISEVSRYMSVDESDIKSKRKTSEIVWARHAAIYITSKVTSISKTQIGKEFKMDHSSVDHAIKNVINKMESDPYKKRSVEELIDNLKKLM